MKILLKVILECIMLVSNSIAIKFLNIKDIIKEQIKRDLTIQKGLK